MKDTIIYKRVTVRFSKGHSLEILDVIKVTERMGIIILECLNGDCVEITKHETSFVKYEKDPYIPTVEDVFYY